MYYSGKTIKKVLCGGCGLPKSRCDTCDNNDMLSDIFDEPADVAEVKRGYWKDLFYFEECSICKHPCDKLYKYCPHCGALMREADK